MTDVSRCSRCGTPVTELDERTDKHGVVLVRCPQCGHEVPKDPFARVRLPPPSSEQVGASTAPLFFYFATGVASAPLCGVLVGAIAQDFERSSVHGTPLSFMLYAPFGVLLGLGLGATFAIVTLALRSKLMLAACCLVLASCGAGCAGLMAAYGGRWWILVFASLGGLGSAFASWRWGRAMMAKRPAP